MRQHVELKHVSIVNEISFALTKCPVCGHCLFFFFLQEGKIQMKVQIDKYF